MYPSVLSLRAMLCWVVRRLKQKRREEQLRCSWRSWARRGISCEERYRSSTTRWISWLRPSRNLKPLRDFWSREQSRWRWGDGALDLISFLHCEILICTRSFSLLCFPQREKLQVEEMLKDVRKNEEEMCQSNQSLLTRLEDVQVSSEV